jgi:cell division protein FtsL
MSRALGWIAVCLAVASICLYSYLNLQHQVTEMKIQVPRIEQEIAAIREENLHLHYQLEKIASPLQLIEIAHRPEFSHLKHPLMKDIVTVAEGIAMQHKTQAQSW